MQVIFRIFSNIVISFILLSGVCIAEIVPLLASFHPKPNYFTGICENCLMDDEVERKFNLDDSKVIGWKYRNPITIKFNLENVKSAFAKTSIHFLSNERVGAYPPISVSIYGAKNEGKYKFLNQISLVDKVWSGVDWVDLEHEVYGNDYILVIHANKKLLFIDEIKSVGSKSSKVSRVYDKHILESDIPGDSVLKLANSYSKNHLNFPKTKIEIVDPWFDEHDSGGILLSSDRVSHIKYNSVSGGKLYVCIKISSELTQKFRLENNSSKNLRFYKLGEVVSSDAKIIMDKILPIQSDFVSVEKNKVFYLWVEIDPEGSVKDEYSFGLSLDKNLGIYNVRVKNDVVSDSNSNSNLLVWGYSLDRPIWSDKKQAIDLLVSAGVNVFTIHPALIPGVNSSLGAEMALKEELEFFRGRGESLLFLAWKHNRNPFLQYMNNEYVLNSKGTSLLRDWLAKVRDIATSARIEQKDWALYITDEPNHIQSTEFVLRIAEQIKVIDSSIRLYVNPDFSRYARQDQDVYMSRIMENFDIVQMTMDYAYKYGERYIGEGNIDWRIYDLPSYPPKSASPLLHYKFPFFKSAKFDISGLGVWSFSSVNGSTATSDIDGASPDWAMVYEGDDGLIRSRRWEALVDGYSDFKLFSQLKRNNEQCVVARIDEIILGGHMEQLHNVGNLYRREFYNECGL